MLRGIKPLPGGLGEKKLDAVADEVIDLSKEKVLVQPDELATALRRLHSLAMSHPNPGLCKRLLAPLLLPLWAVSSWPEASSPVTKRLQILALELLKIYLKLVPATNTLLSLIHNLGYAGGWDKQNPGWMYAETSQGEIQIIDVKDSMGRTSRAITQLPLDQIGQKTTKFLELVTSSFSDSDISAAFIGLFGRWMRSAQRPRSADIIIKQEEADEQDPVAQLTEVKVLQAMMEAFPEKLANQPKHILELVSQVLAASKDAPEEDDEATGVALSLLNMVITVPGFQKSRVGADVLGNIESGLDALSRGNNPDTASTARNLALLLQYRDEVDGLSGAVTARTDREIEDRKAYSLAVSYISQSDSPPPVKFEGLSLIAGLITSQSPILDIPGILVLMSSQISDAEDYINLQVIKIYTLLASKHPKAVTKELLDHYVDPKETASVDARLRFGEALLQVIERLGETFAGEAAQQVGDALVSVAGRRGYRPKTEARQAKEERLRRMKNREAEEVWEGEVPDLSDDVPAEERVRNEILSRIVEGWESKRGTEDVRIRASALSILGNAMETNIAGLGSALVSTAVDLAMKILQLEPEMEKGILRRAAILLVLSFARALGQAKQTGRRLGFGLAAQEDIVRTLGYVAATDNDGLVRQHANDVIESLENLQMSKLATDAEAIQGQAAGTSLTKLAGLEVDPERSVSSRRTTSKPKIEEVE